MAHTKSDQHSPLEEFGFSKRLITLLADPIGLDLLRRDFHLTKRFFITLGLTIIYFTCFFYTCYVFQDNILKMLEAICMNGLSIPGLVKLVKGLQNWRLYVSMDDFGVMMFNPGSMSQASSYYKLLRMASRRHVKLIKRSLWVLFLAIVIFMLHPAYTYLQGEKPLIIPVVLIGFDATTAFGYYIHIGYQIVVTIITGCGMLAMDVFLIEAISIYSISNDLVAYHCKQIGELKTNMSAESLLYEKLYFRNVIMLIQDINEYMSKMKFCFDFMVSITVALGCASISLALFLIISNNWYAGVGWIIFNYMQMLTLSIFATIIQNYNRELPVVIYKDTNWYKFPLSEQRLIINLLACTQNEEPKEFWLFGIAPINLELATTVRYHFQYGLFSRRYWSQTKFFRPFHTFCETAIKFYNTKNLSTIYDDVKLLGIICLRMAEYKCIIRMLIKSKYYLSTLMRKLQQRD